MNLEEKQKAKKEILRQIDSVKKDLEDLKANIRPIVADRSCGRMGNIEALQHKDINDRHIKSLESKLYGLERNLRSIDTPDFEICEACKRPISEARRQALPETKICIECARKVS